MAGVVVDQVCLPSPLGARRELRAAEMYDDAPFWHVAGDAGDDTSSSQGAEVLVMPDTKADLA